ncbi:PIG-L deacetylase family protein [Paracoccus rhizosphaerae]|uniref:PIG-L deacetylase family protein n=1 Tax=Paracoccus rhizosphaerae TaxID=1133347 RepID=A0ABV6CKF6_9RHOB|nr:PIG-L deacetylase family protein [Paracoccus rhizosphaerae]
MAVMRLQPVDGFVRVDAAGLLDGRQALVVLAPHPDDETLGCGALLAEAAALGVDCRVICVTDGHRSHPGSVLWPKPRLVAQRRKELADAMARLGPIEVHHLGFPDCAAPDGGPVVAQVSALVPQGALFLSTWSGDPHVDHQSCARLADTLARSRPDLRHLAYPIWGRLRPDLPFPATGFRLCADRPEKAAALACHESQMTGLIPDDPDGFTMEPELQRLFLTEPEVFLAP